MKLKLFALLSLLLSASSHAAVILQYHHVAIDTPHSTSVTPAQFASHLALLKQHNFTVISLQRLIDAQKSQQNLPDKSVVITFDDGYQNNADNAHPLLKQYGYPYTIFVNPELIDSKQPGLMTWDTLRKLANEGATIANHSSRHDYLVRNQSADWLALTRSDILSAEQRIDDEIGYSKKWLAYPYGEFSLSLQQLVKDLDFVGIGQHSGPVGLDNDLSRLPRFPASGHYAGTEQLLTKLHSLPFALEFSKLADMKVTQNPPHLTLHFKQLDFMLSQVQCFFQGEPKLALSYPTKSSMQIELKGKLPEGRSRYNCTAPSNRAKGRFYWFSQPWLVAF